MIEIFAISLGVLAISLYVQARFAAREIRRRRGHPNQAMNGKVAPPKAFQV